jgi:hypothetical protein
MPVQLFSRPIRSGKTTELYRRLAEGPALFGVLAPDRDGLRYLELIPDGGLLPFQVPAEVEVEPQQLEHIGRFRFYRKAFEAAQVHLKNLAEQGASPLVIDEVGPLELAGGGFEPALGAIIRTYYRDPDRILILVVRDTLKAALCAHYQIEPK